MSGALEELRAAVAGVPVRRETARRWEISAVVPDPTGREDWTLRVEVPSAWSGVDYAVDQLVSAVVNFLASRPEMTRYRPNIAGTLLRKVAEAIREQTAARLDEELRRGRKRTAANGAEEARYRANKAGRERRERAAARITAQIEAGV